MIAPPDMEVAGVGAPAGPRATGSGECISPCSGLCGGRILCGSDKQAAIASVGVNLTDYAHEPPYVYVGAQPLEAEPLPAGTEHGGAGGLAARIARSLRVSVAEAADEMKSSDPKKALPWYAIALLCGVLLIVGVVTLVSSRPVAQPPASSTTQVPGPTTQLYDCEAGFTEWQTKWTLGQKVWCCHYYGKACPSATQAQASASASAEQFDCQVGASNPGGWTDDRRDYCCRRFGKGCHVSAGSEASGLYNCSAGFATWHSGWSVAKKLWCCEKGAGTCPQRQK